MICTNDKPCANCVAILKACEHETTYKDGDKVICVFCDEVVKSIVDDQRKRNKQRTD